MNSQPLRTFYARAGGGIPRYKGSGLAFFLDSFFLPFLYSTILYFTFFSSTCGTPMEFLGIPMEIGFVFGLNADIIVLLFIGLVAIVHVDLNFLSSLSFAIFNSFQVKFLSFFGQKRVIIPA